ncbi:MAG: aminotransferase class I/II-fold pyridoxal phosphate-dependent enzyme, partial [Candidatus Marinimicrobia bacterium]|nr:aminotransferase class I/II-fold pyridoxal phosphate-dependent enzyme [Candidatus Neomarinimicrobiota bacterium]
FVWAKIPVKYKNGDEFSDWLLEKHHIFVTPGSVFGKNGEGYVRVSLCANQETLHQVKERLA